HFFKEKMTDENPCILDWVFKIHKELKPIGRGCLSYQARRLFTCALYCPEVTEFGLRLPSHDFENNFERVPLDPELMGSKAEHFWPRLPWDFLSFYREVVGASNCPVEPSTFFKEVPLFQGDLGEAQRLVDNLLAEAVDLKQGTIPPGAYHPIGQGSNLLAVKMFELGAEVAAGFADTKGDFFLATCNPRGRAIRVIGPEYEHLYRMECAKAQPRGEIDDRKPSSETVDRLQARVDETLERFEMGIKLFLATLIRDFWVVEERESVFGTASLVKRVPKLRADRHARVI